MKFWNKRNKIEFFHHELSIVDNFPIIETKDLKLQWVNRVKQDFEYSGQIWNDYNNNKIDDLKTYVNTSNIHFNGNMEWIDFTLKLKKSSLENPLQQPKDRYSLLLKNKIIDLNFGDFYPQFDKLVLNGNRVRGVGLDFHLKFFQLNLISGELNTAIQGDPSQNLNITLSEEYDENLATDINLLTISRMPNVLPYIHLSQLLNQGLKLGQINSLKDVYQ